MTTLIFISLFPLIGLIVLGYVLKHKAFVDDYFWKGAEKINYYLFFPAMLFLNLATAKVDVKAINNILMVLTIVVFIVVLFLYVIRKIIKIPSVRFGVYMQSLVRFNTYIGLAVIASLFQQKGMTIFAIILVFGIPLVNVLSVLALTDSDHMKPKEILFSVVKNPLILGSVCGGIYNILGFGLWNGAEQFLKQLALCSLPLGLMCVGAALQFKGLKEEFSSVVLNVLGRMIVVPSLAFIVCTLLNIPKLETQILILFFALPTASAAYILTKVLGGDYRLMASIISMQTVCAAVTLPIILFKII